MSMESNNTRILGVGGGKGGVGKSVVSANLAVALAALGKRTILIDADLGGANLHTLFDLSAKGEGVGDFIYGDRSKKLEDYAIETGIENVWFISGNGLTDLSTLPTKMQLKK